MTPGVSVIMPAWQAEKYIAESIQSVLAQQYRNWELLVVIDGATDNTADIVESFAAVDKRIRVIRQPNAGPAAARNKGLECAGSEIVAFLDADDKWNECFLSVQTDLLRSSGADLVFGDAWIIDQVMETGRRLGGRPECLEGKEGIWLMIQGNRVPILTVLARKEAILKAGGFNPVPQVQRVEDYDLWLRMLECGYTLLGSGEPMASYRLHHEAATANDRNVAVPKAYMYLFRQQAQTPYSHLYCQALRMHLASMEYQQRSMLDPEVLHACGWEESQANYRNAVGTLNRLLRSFRK